MTTTTLSASGYRHCAHFYCFAIVVGQEGALCDDCADASGDPIAASCQGCDNDSPSEQTPADVAADPRA